MGWGVNTEVAELIGRDEGKPYRDRDVRSACISAIKACGVNLGSVPLVKADLPLVRFTFIPWGERMLMVPKDLSSLGGVLKKLGVSVTARPSDLGKRTTLPVRRGSSVEKVIEMMEERFSFWRYLSNWRGEEEADASLVDLAMLYLRRHVSI